MELLRRGAADLVLAGGGDSLLTYSALAGFLRLDVMSRNVGLSGIWRRVPSTSERDGFVMGEGAGFVVLQRAGDAAAAGRQVLGYVLGHASTADAFNLVAPSVDGAGRARLHAAALADAACHRRRPEPRERARHEHRARGLVGSDGARDALRQATGCR